MRRSLTDDQEKQVAAAYAEGQSGRSLALALEVDPSVIYDAIRRQGGTVRDLKAANADNARRASQKRAKVGQRERAAIIRRYAAGESTYILADAFSLSQAHIWRILQQAGTSMRSCSEARRQYPLDEEAFLDAHKNEAAAYFVGLIMSDGCVEERQYGWRMSISLAGEDGQLVRSLAAFLKTGHPVYVDTRRPVPMTRLVIDSTPLVQRLRQYGIEPRKSLTARVIGLEQNRHFWRGMIDGDGWVTVANGKPQIGLVGSRPTLDQFFAFASPLTQCKARVLPMHSIFRLGLSSQPAIRLVRHLYDPCTIALPRKLATARVILATA